MKLGVKLLYSIAHHPQTDGVNKQINQTIEITLQVFVHVMDDPSWWLEVLPRIQSRLNNIPSFTTEKTPNEIAYGFLPRRLIDLCLAATLPNTYVAHIEAADVILFTFASHKKYYNRSHQLLFMKVGDCAMLKLYKGYSIPFFVRVTKKLTQQYISSFRIIKKVGRHAYKLDILSD